MAGEAIDDTAQAAAEEQAEQPSVLRNFLFTPTQAARLARTSFEQSQEHDGGTRTVSQACIVRQAVTTFLDEVEAGVQCIDPDA